MGDFHKMIETRLDRAVDKAIAEQNAAFLANPEAMAAAEESGERWRQITKAREVVGRHGVVLPLAVAEDILAALEGRETALSAFNPNLPASMLRSAIGQVES